MAKKNGKKPLPGLPQSVPDPVDRAGVVSVLEDALVEAKAGRLVAIGLVRVRGHDMCSCSWVGGYASTVVMGATNLQSSVIATIFRYD